MEMDFTSCFNGMFGKLGAGMCRLTMNGKIAVKTSGGYKSYNVKTGKLTNCSNFVFNIGDDFFFIIPTNKVDVGDIILVNDSANGTYKVYNVQGKLLHDFHDYNKPIIRSIGDGYAWIMTGGESDSADIYYLK